MIRVPRVPLLRPLPAFSHLPARRFHRGRFLSSSASSPLSSFSRPLPAVSYTSQKIFDHERTQVFGSNWIFYCRRSELSTPGSFVSRTIAGMPVVVLHHEKSGELVGFHNVCAHRGAPLVAQEKTPCASSGSITDSVLSSTGSSSPSFLQFPHLFQCRYHGWLYDSQTGELKATPNFQTGNCPLTADQRAGLGLKKVEVSCWQGELIFVKLNCHQTNTKENSPASDPRDFALLDRLRSLDPHLKEFPLSNYHFLASHEEILHCNWKIYIENYQEGYHIKRVHKELAGILKNNLYTVENHHQLYSIHSCPAADAKPGKSSETPGLIEQEDSFLWLFLYPNLALNYYKNIFSIEEILPIGKDKVQLRFQIFGRNPSEQQEKEKSENPEEFLRKQREWAIQTLERSAAIIQEDRLICEELQKNFEGGVYRPGILSPKMEVGVQMVQQNIRRDLAGVVSKEELN